MVANVTQATNGIACALQLNRPHSIDERRRHPTMLAAAKVLAPNRRRLKNSRLQRPIIMMFQEIHLSARLRAALDGARRSRYAEWASPLQSRPRPPE